MVDKEKTCSRCGAVDGGRDRPHVVKHHIIPLSEGGEDTEDNIEYLCLQCHGKVHYWAGKVDDPPHSKADKLVRLNIDTYFALDSHRLKGESFSQTLRRLLYSIDHTKDLISKLIEIWSKGG